MRGIDAERLTCIESLTVDARATLRVWRYKGATCKELTTVNITSEQLNHDQRP